MDTSGGSKQRMETSAPAQGEFLGSLQATIEAWCQAAAPCVSSTADTAPLDGFR